MRFLLLILVTSLPAVAWANNSIRWAAADPKPTWVWDADGVSDGQTIYLQKSFTLAQLPKSAKLYTTCDNQMTLWINGTRIGSSPDWPQPIHQDVAKQLRPGKNLIAVQASNAGGVAAFVFKLVLDTGEVIGSDTTWKMSREKPAGSWTSDEADKWTGRLKELGTLGVQPWGLPGRPSPGSVTQAEDIQTLDGFTVESVYTVPKETEGSWVSLTRGPDGRLIACDQGGMGAFLVRVVESENGPRAEVEPIEVNEPGSDRRLSGAQGLLWAFDALWFHRNGGPLYRITDSNGDGRLDQAEVIPSQTGGGEHGNHAVILTEDGDGIYMVGGNHAPLAELTSSRVVSWDEDLLLPRMWDANGHARGKLAPGGWVTRLDPTSMQQELICIGFRNEYDVALNRFGDLFTYDADMEWDLGAPWYRPTRICQVLSGADYGWRSGTGKWPTYYEDSLPPVVEIGPGSPTGVVAGLGAKFPAKYQDAMFALDWTFGTIYAIHLQPDGAGYRGSSEPFITGAPLPVTDAIVGDDGALYFTVGGRGTQSALYRCRYTGSESTAPVSGGLPDDVTRARDIRKQLERFHGRPSSEEQAEATLATIWPHLASEDRYIRAAARVALESQPVTRWDERALSETSPQALITSAVALARCGDEKHQSRLLARLTELMAQELSRDQTLGALRAISLTCIRLGTPDEGERQSLLARLDPLFPNSDGDVNTELVNVLVYLNSPSVVGKTLELIHRRPPTPIPDWSELASRNAGYGGTVQRVLDNHPPSREIGFALALSHVRSGWTIDQRRQYFEFLNEAARASGGASFPGFMRNIREEALGNCTDAERVALQDITGESYDPVPDFEIAPIRGPGRQWTIEEARRVAGQLRDADFESGRSVYFAANCGKCHRFAGLGGNVGPDLTSIPRKFDVNYVVEHIIDPSKIVSDQYQSSTVLTADGRTLTGLVSQADGKTVVYPADVTSDPITLADEDVEAIRPSDLSQMPKGLIDPLSPEELRDLLGYLMSGGERK